MSASARPRLARWRVPLGFVAAAAALLLARPTLPTVAAGALVACLGEAIRVWAAGHLEKSREVTSSGPYRFSRHPLYVGSTIMGAGFALACNHLLVAALVAAYLGVTLTAAVRSEEAFLRERFGPRYDAYARGAVRDDRHFSLRRALKNREYRAVAGLAAVIVLLAFKAMR